MRCHCRVEDGRQPFSPKVLLQVLKALLGICHATFEVAMIRAAFWLAPLFCAFRISELVARSKSDSSGQALQLDVECLELGICARL